MLPRSISLVVLVCTVLLLGVCGTQVHGVRPHARRTRVVTSTRHTAPRFPGYTRERDESSGSSSTRSVQGAPATPSTGLIFQGFDYRWERRLAGFKVPHRLGTFVANITSEAYAAGTSSGTVHGNAKSTFTTGVDGDFAHPVISAVNMANAPGVEFLQTQAQFTFTDNCSTTTPTPFAETTKVTTVSVPATPGAVSVALFHGLAIDMNCDPAKQPAGKECNSNAIWPYKLGVTVGEVVVSGGMATSNVTLQVFRGWTPTNGGGKPFNYVLDYHVYIDVKILQGAKGDFLVADDHTYNTTGQLQSTAGPPAQQWSHTGPTGYETGVFGITGFSFLLTSDTPAKGRYLETLSFYVNQATYNPSTGVLSGGGQMSVTAPSTTVKSSVTSTLSVVPLYFGSLAQAQPAFTVTGTVCSSGFGFSCKLKGLPENTTSITSFSSA